MRFTASCRDRNRVRRSSRSARRIPGRNGGVGDLSASGELPGFDCGRPDASPGGERFLVPGEGPQHLRHGDLWIPWRPRPAHRRADHRRLPVMRASGRSRAAHGSAFASALRGELGPGAIQRPPLGPPSVSSIPRSSGGHGKGRKRMDQRARGTRSSSGLRRTLPRAWSPRRTIAGCAAATLFLFFLCHSAWAGGPPASLPGRAKNARLRCELIRLAEEDHAGVILFSGTDVRTRNQERLKEILTEVGWPGTTLVGKDGAYGAWLIAQHADYDLPFQKRCLELLRDAFRWKEVPAWQVAYLTDRVASNEKEPQTYGTQGIGVKSPEDEVRVDKNRKALGLEPWHVFVENFKKGIDIRGPVPTTKGDPSCQ